MEWINPSKAIPEDNYRVLVTNNEYVMEAYRRNGKWWSSCFRNNISHEVALWAEIPSPPTKALSSIPIIHKK